MLSVHQRASSAQVSPPALGADALIEPIAGVVRLCASGDEAVVLAFWLAAVSAYAGRSVGVRVGGRLVWPNIHVGVADWGSTRPTLEQVMRFFELYPPPPLVISSGIRDVESLLHIIRDPVVRAERVQIRGVTKFKQQLVDAGETERRVFLTQPLHSLLNRRSVASKSLLAALLTTFEGGAVNYFVRGAVTGHWLRSAAPHVVVISDVHPEVLGTVIYVGGSGGGWPPAFSTSEPDPCIPALATLDSVMGEIIAHPFPAEFGIDSSAQDILCKALTDLGRSCLLVPMKLGKIAALYAFLDCANTICAPHARAAAALLRYSTDLAQYRRDRVRSDDLATRICEVLAAAPVGVSQSKLLRQFRTFHANEIGAVLDKLLAAGQIQRTRIRTKGHHRTIWSAA